MSAEQIVIIDSRMHEPASPTSVTPADNGRSFSFPDLEQYPLARLSRDDPVRGAAIDMFGTLLIDESKFDNPYDSLYELVEAHKGGLPPRDFWIGNPFKDKVKPVFDTRGLVNVAALIDEVKATIDPDYPWFGRRDGHHVYWPAEFYIPDAHLINPVELPMGLRQHYQSVMPGVLTSNQTLLDNPALPHVFRTQAFNIKYMSRVLHNWTHKVSWAPEMPDPDAMRAALAAQKSVKDFSNVTKKTLYYAGIFERERVRRGGYTEDDEAMIKSILGREVGGMLFHLQALREVDASFLPFAPETRMPLGATEMGRLLVAAELDHFFETDLWDVA
ncbi:MAG: hypothetical protein JWM81_714 [Candidatus Saccharibacteria bacterium]|nr:hypothetical protein [Candidatus Saccharibacteria bacterium]